jgi:hypothetical protein
MAEQKKPKAKRKRKRGPPKKAKRRPPRKQPKRTPGWLYQVGAQSGGGDPDPIPLQRIRYFNNSGRPTLATVTIESEPPQEPPETTTIVMPDNGEMVQPGEGVLAVPEPPIMNAKHVYGSVLVLMPDMTPRAHAFDGGISTQPISEVIIHTVSVLQTNVIYVYEEL